MFDFEAPRTTEALSAGLADLHQEILVFATGLPDEEFGARQAEHWSPAEHLRHLSTAVRAMAKGLATPKALLALRFGVGFGGSRSFEQVREVYQAALSDGAQASGRYDPAKRALDMPSGEQRAFVLERWSQAGEQFDRALAGWSEWALDHLRAKHPLLGLMTVRELLYFTLYHNAHHARRIAERRA